MESRDFQNPKLPGQAFLWKAGEANPAGVLLFHGFTATTAEVRPLAQALHRQGYTVSAPLLPGHGTTPSDLNRRRWPEWVEAAEDAYRQLAKQSARILVGGESMGALLALMLASQHPEITAVLAYAPALHIPALERVEWAAPFLPTKRKKRIDEDMPWQGYTVYPLRAAVQLKQLQAAVMPRLPLIRQPVLIVQGKLDQTIHPDSGAWLFQRVGSPIKELHWMEHSTHCVILDREQDEIFAFTLKFVELVLEKASP